MSVYGNKVVSRTRERFRDGTRPADFRKIILDELQRVETVVREAKITVE